MSKKIRKKKLYVIPGIGESTRCKNYTEITRFAKKSGFSIVPVNIKWDTDMIMGDFIKMADEKIPNECNNDYILGFSFGSYITAVLSPKKNAQGFIFCSTSPYFKDDLKNIPEESKKYFGKRMMNSFKKYTFPKNVKNSAYFLIGDNDWDIAIKKMEQCYKSWKGRKEKYIIKNTGHNLGDKNYTKTIKNIIKKL